MRKTMHFNKRFIALLAICAMLCNSLLPTLVFAKAAANPSILAELCTTGDTKLVSLDQFSAQQPAKAPLSQGKIHSTHCPLCSTSAHLALPYSDTPAAFITVIAGISFVPFRSTPRAKQLNLSSAQPRGPPSLV
ncbi:MAG TPA: DUF2946 domain-containing protein [Burkholderiaceae bacterium]|jgi:hypothetical protein